MVREIEGYFCELYRRSVRRGIHEMTACFRLYSAENVGRAPPLIFRCRVWPPVPGVAGDAERTSAWRVTGFSSRHTTGSSGL